MDVSSLVRKEDYNEKIKDITIRYFTTSEYNKFMNNILDTKIKNKKLVNISDISGILNNTDLSEKKGRIKSRARENSKASSISFTSFC